MGEGGIAAGIRRVEAVTGEVAFSLVQDMDARISQVAATMKVQPEDIGARLNQWQDQMKSLEKEVAALKSKLASNQADAMLSQATEINGVKVLVASLDGADANALRDSVTRLKDQLKTAVVVLASVIDGKVSLTAGVSADCTSKVKAGDLVNFVAQQVGGKGGGRPDMAQAGGTNPEGLPAALAAVPAWLAAKL